MAYDPDFELKQAMEQSMREYKEKEEKKPLCGDIPAPVPFKKISTKADGNCLFHAIGQEVNKTASEVRKEICDFYDNFSRNINSTKRDIKLIKNILEEEYVEISNEDLKEIIKADENKEIGKRIKEYSKNMRKDSVYGGTPEIMIASIIYSKTIFVFLKYKDGYRYEIFINFIKKSPIYLFLCNSNGYEASEANHYLLLEIDEELYGNISIYDMINESSDKWMLFKSKNLKKSKTKNLKKSKTNSKTKKSKIKSKKSNSKIKSKTKKSKSKTKSKKSKKSKTKSKI